MSIRVLLVDDFELVHDGLRMVLDPAPDIEVVGEVGDGLAGVSEAERLRPVVVLTDVRMPGLDGLDATRRMVDLDGPPIRVVMLTTFDLEEYLLEAVRAGVSGFTLKDAPADELLDGIRALAEGTGLIAPDRTTQLIEQMTRSRPPSPPPDGLTDTDRELLGLLARGYSNASIARELGGAVADDVAALLTKLSVRDRLQAVVRANECRLA
ncbi:MAG: response regulator transcription factor [Solirubrobacteraceae bacterium]